MAETDSNPPGTFRKVLALSVHLFTSLGIVTGFMAILAIQEHDWRMAMLWLLAGLVIDGIDGTFARWVKVKEVLPEFDGNMIDYVIDFANYALIPAYFFYESGLFPPSVNLFATCCILLVSAMYYGKTGMVTDDFHFVGFPVMWNMAALYFFFVFQWTSWVTFGAVILLSILHFVPIKYLYPSRAKELRYLNIAVTVIFFGVNTLIVLLYPQPVIWLSVVSIGTVVYLGGISVYHTFRPPNH